MSGNFPAVVLNCNRLFLKLNRFICNYTNCRFSRMIVLGVLHKRVLGYFYFYFFETEGQTANAKKCIEKRNQDAPSRRGGGTPRTRHTAT